MTAFRSNRIRTLVPMATYNCHSLIIGKVEMDIYCYLTADILTEMFLELSSTNRMNFVQTAEFDWLPWQPKL